MKSPENFSSEDSNPDVARGEIGKKVEVAFGNDAQLNEVPIKSGPTVSDAERLKAVRTKLAESGSTPVPIKEWNTGRSEGINIQQENPDKSLKVPQSKVSILSRLRKTIALAGVIGFGFGAANDTLGQSAEQPSKGGGFAAAKVSRNVGPKKGVLSKIFHFKLTYEPNGGIPYVPQARVEQSNIGGVIQADKRGIHIDKANIKQTRVENR